MLPVLGGIAIVAIMAAISDTVSYCPSSAIIDAYREVSEQIKTVISATISTFPFVSFSP